MAKLTQEAKEFIKKNMEFSNRALKDSLLEEFGIEISHAAIGRYKLKVKSESMDTFMDTKKFPDKPKPIDAKEFLREYSFGQFMTKLKMSDSYPARHLKGLLEVKGKYRSQNKEKVIRIIRDVLDVYKE